MRGEAIIGLTAVFWMAGLCLVPESLWGADQGAKSPLHHPVDEGITIRKVESRTKATIPSSGQKGPTERPNLIYQGLEEVAQGLFFAAKTSVDEVGKGTDFSIRSVQSLSGKTYEWMRDPFQKRQESEQTQGFLSSSTAAGTSHAESNR